MTEANTIDQALLDIQGDIELVQAEANLARRTEDDGWIIDWYMQQQFMLDEAHKKIDEQAALLHRQLDARRKALEYVHGRVFQAEANKRIASLKKGKTVTTFFGKFGLRSVGGKPKVLVVDEPAAIAAAELTAPEAISCKKSILKTAVLELHQNGVDLPGCIFETEPKHDEFFIKTEGKALPEPQQGALE